MRAIFIICVRTTYTYIHIQGGHGGFTQIPYTVPYTATNNTVHTVHSPVPVPYMKKKFSCTYTVHTFPYVFKFNFSSAQNLNFFLKIIEKYIFFTTLILHSYQYHNVCNTIPIFILIRKLFFLTYYFPSRVTLLVKQ